MENRTLKLADITGLWMGFNTDTVTKFYLEIKEEGSGFKASLSHGIVYLLAKEILKKNDVILNHVNDSDYELLIDKNKFMVTVESEPHKYFTAKSIVKHLHITIDQNKVEFYKND